MVSGIVIAGGASRRLGLDKRALRLWGAAGPTLLARTVATLGQLCAEVVVVLNDPERWPDLPARLVCDSYADGGPLGGVYSGLQAAAHPFALVVAADMPLLQPALLRAMLGRERSFDLLVPRSLSHDGTRNRLGVEPLHALYGKACLAPMARALERGERAIAACFQSVRLEVVEPHEIRRYDPQGLSFRNINTPADLAAIQQLIA
jgi:molybdopterin-guanine dinucleotide biosynthesis protein A